MKREDVQFHSYPWHQIGISDELHAQAALTQRKEYPARTEWEVSWVPQPVWTDALKNRKKISCSLSGIESQFLDRTACSLVNIPAEPSRPLYKIGIS